jgi:GNAT superfamily N-acetyltransferase
MVQEWDPATAPEAELAAVVDLLNAAGEVDVPDDPRGDSTVTASICLHDAGRAAGLLDRARPARRPPPRPGQRAAHGRHRVIDLIVHPDARNHGVGSALLLAMARRAADEGVPALGVEAIGDTPAVPF